MIKLNKKFTPKMNLDIVLDRINQEVEHQLSEFPADYYEKLVVAHENEETLKKEVFDNVVENLISESRFYKEQEIQKEEISEKSLITTEKTVSPATCFELQNNISVNEFYLAIGIFCFVIFSLLIFIIVILRRKSYKNKYKLDSEIVIKV